MSNKPNPTANESANTLHTHVMSPKTLLAVFGALLVLTGLTAGASAFHLGTYEIWFTIAIASAKASLVLIYFMHLRYDSSFNSIIFLTAVVCLAIFLALTLADTDHSMLRLPSS